jgi:hypothetical protein
MAMSPAGLGIKNDYAGEGQQQFTRHRHHNPNSMVQGPFYEANIYSVGQEILCYL